MFEENEYPVKKERVVRRPLNEGEIEAEIERLSNGVFKSISDGPWVESVDEDREVTTFSYRGINLPGYTFELSWKEVQGSSLEKNEEMSPLP